MNYCIALIIIMIINMIIRLLIMMVFMIRIRWGRPVNQMGYIFNEMIGGGSSELVQYKSVVQILPYIGSKTNPGAKTEKRNFI